MRLIGSRKLLLNNAILERQVAMADLTSFLAFTSDFMHDDKFSIAPFICSCLTAIMKLISVHSFLIISLLFHISRENSDSHI